MTKPTTFQRRDLYAEMTERVLAALRAGTTPWRKPWASMPAPLNATTGRTYRGINLFLLSMSGYGNAGWLSYRQALAAGGHVRKGEKGTTVVYFTMLEKPSRKPGALPGDKDLIPLLKHSTVFNVEQCEGLPERVVARGAAREASGVAADDAAVAAVVGMADAAGIVRVDGGGSAWYSPERDVVGMPPLAAFSRGSDYAATLAHEATHWTGGKARLDRDQSGGFGSADYAREELVAEFGSAFVCARLGVGGEVAGHASYLAHWVRLLEDDSKALMRAATAAQKAADLLLGKAEDADMEAAA
jgi:antirestriction protein ArdC